MNNMILSNTPWIIQCIFSVRTGIKTMSTRIICKVSINCGDHFLHSCNFARIYWAMSLPKIPHWLRSCSVIGIKWTMGSNLLTCVCVYIFFMPITWKLQCQSMSVCVFTFFVRLMDKLWCQFIFVFHLQEHAWGNTGDLFCLPWLKMTSRWYQHNVFSDTFTL